jgi:hypothetical protein
MSPAMGTVDDECTTFSLFIITFSFHSSAINIGRDGMKHFVL